MDGVETLKPCIVRPNKPPVWFCSVGCRGSVVSETGSVLESRAGFAADEVCTSCGAPLVEPVVLDAVELATDAAGIMAENPIFSREIHGHIGRAEEVNLVTEAAEAMQRFRRLRGGQWGEGGEKGLPHPYEVWPVVALAVKDGKNVTAELTRLVDGGDVGEKPNTPVTPEATSPAPADAGTSKAVAAGTPAGASAPLWDGGPAYPSRTKTGLYRPDGLPQTTMVEDGYRGMSLRDYFAAKAMQAWLGNTGAMNQLVAEVEKARIEGREQRVAIDFVIARRAYTLADAMLKRRAKGGSPAR